MLAYPINLKHRAGGLCTVMFPDFPEAAASASSEARAIRMARASLVKALSAYWKERRIVPMPSAPKRGQPVVTLPTSMAAKVLLRNELTKRKMRSSAFARLLGRTAQYVDRLTDLRCVSKIDSFADAFLVLNKKLQFQVVAAEVVSKSAITKSGQVARTTVQAKGARQRTALPRAKETRAKAAAAQAKRGVKGKSP